MEVALRPASPADENFIRTLISEAILNDLGIRDWPENLRAPLLESQYAARRSTEGDSYIIEAGRTPAGWLLTASTDDALWIVQILIDPAHRNKGIGTAALQHVISTAGKPVRLNVDLTNPAAARLYQRLGFHPLDNDGVQYELEYRPVSASQKPL